MKSTLIPRAVLSLLAVFTTLTAAACGSFSKRSDVWTLLANGDSRAKGYFLGKVDSHAVDSKGRGPLHYAAERKDPNLAAFFVALGSPVDAVDKKKQTPLGISVEKEDPLVARVLAAGGANIHKPAKTGLSPARSAIRMKGAFLEALLTPATVESTDADGKNILHMASEEGKVEAVNTILAAIAPAGSATPNAGVNTWLNAKDHEENTPLDLALARPYSRDHMEVAALLILAGAVSENPIYPYLAPAVRSANYNLRRADGLSPLHYAAGNGYDGLIAFLLEKRANVNLKNLSGATSLHEAARSGNLRAIEMILQLGADVNVQDAKGNSVLHIGIPPESHQKAIDLLLSYGANPNLRDEHGESPLHIMVTLNRGHGVIQALLDGGADVSIRNISGKTALYVAVEENRAEIIPLLLSSGSDIFAADNSGITPFDRAILMKGPILEAMVSADTTQQRDNAGNTMLHAAVKNRGDQSIIGLILQQRIMINARNKEGDTALHIAVRTNQRETGEVLLARGADIFSVNASGESPLYLALTHPAGVVQWMFNDQTITARDGLGNSILHYAALWQMNNHIPFIIQKGLPVDTTNASGETALFMAVKYNGDSTVHTLLGERANLNARDNLGNSALHAAVRWNALDAALALMDAGIDINAHSLNGTTPLHDAVGLGITNLAGILIRRGANIEARDSDGNTPFMEAVTAGFANSIELLAERGADPMTRNARGDTPLHIAVATERIDMVNLLLRMGASIHARNTRNRTPFQLALANTKSPGMVTALLTRDRIHSSDDFGNSVLHVALQEHSPSSTVKSIIDQGARLGAVDSNGRTPLRLTVDMEAWDTTKVLADAGSDPFSIAADGKTPAEIVLAKGSNGIRALFSGKAISASDASGNTILHYAARLGKPAAISLLLELGANKHIKNIAAESPADIATRWNHPENVALLN
jgi:ankyrin repeat protein